VGAIVIVFVEFFASTYMPARWPLILGLIFIAAPMYLQGGIGPYLYGYLKRIQARLNMPVARGK
jgi:hypothetical protein